MPTALSHILFSGPRVLILAQCCRLLQGGCAHYSFPRTVQSVGCSPSVCEGLILALLFLSSENQSHGVWGREWRQEVGAHEE